MRSYIDESESILLESIRRLLLRHARAVFQNFVDLFVSFMSFGVHGFPKFRLLTQSMLSLLLLLSDLSLTRITFSGKHTGVHYILQG